MLKKITFVLLAASLFLLQAVPSYAAIQGSDYVGATSVSDRNLTITEAPSVDCKYGILCAADGTVLWSRQPNEQSAMASITKTMTALVALENGNLKDKYTISAKAAQVGESSIELTKGSKVSLYDLLCGLLVHSGNDAATAIAEGVSGNVKSFVKLMNAKVEELGLENTHFTNPHGLDAKGHYSSAADICVIARYAMQNKTFRKIVKMRKVTLTYGGKKHTFRSTNSLLNTWDECEGIKTGFTDDAGYCLVSAAKRKGIELYAVVLGCSDEAQRFTDSYKLLDWGFSHYRSVQLAQAGDVIVDAPLSGYLDKTVPATVAKDVSAKVLDYDGNISIDIKLIDISDGVNKGDTVGTITWRQSDIALASAPLIASNSVAKPNAFISVWTAMNRLVGWFTGDDCIAESKSHVSVIEVKRVDDLSGEEIDSDLEESIESDAHANG